MYSNSMHNNMMRRNNNTVKTVGIVVVAGLFLYGLYAYHDLHTRHTRSEEKADRLRQQHDSLSAQLQVVYEQKSRLDKLLQQEKADHKQSKDDLNSEKRRIEQKYLAEKQELLNRIKSISAEHKMLQNQHEDLENTFTKLQQQLLQLDDDCKKASEQHQQEYNQMKQEKENELAQVRDDLANMQRHNVELQRQLQAAIQQNQISQHQVDAEQQNIEKLREQLAQLQGNLVANLAQEQKVQTFNERQQPQGVVDSAAQQQAQQQLIAQQGAVQDAYKIKQQGSEGQKEQQAQLKEIRQNAGLQDTQQQEGLLEDRHAAIQHKEQPQPDQQQQQAPVMQLAQPDEQRKPYFDPKEARPDHEVIIHDVKEQNEEDNNAGAVHHQVLAPNINQKPGEADKRVKGNHAQSDHQGALVPPILKAEDVHKENNAEGKNRDYGDGNNEGGNNDDQFYNEAKADGGDDDRATVRPVMAPAGALGAEQAQDELKVENVVARPQKMELVEPAKRESVNGPDGRVNVDNLDVANIGRGRNVVNQQEQPKQEAHGGQADQNDVLVDQAEKYNARSNKLFNALKPAIAA